MRRRLEGVPYRFLTEGLRVRLPGRTIEVLAGTETMLLIVDGEQISYDVLDPTPFLTGPVSDATDAEMLQALASAVEAVLRPVHLREP